MCGSELTFVDLDAGEVLVIGNADITIIRNNFSFTDELLIANRHYNVTVRAYNIAGETTSYTTLSEYYLGRLQSLYWTGLDWNELTGLRLKKTKNTPCKCMLFNHFVSAIQGPSLDLTVGLLTFDTKLGGPSTCDATWRAT